VVVRGFDLADPAIEHDVRIPAADWAFLIAQLSR
jgi:hypothetical protein